MCLSDVKPLGNSSGLFAFAHTGATTVPEFMRAYIERAAEGAGKPGEPMRFIASTENVARDGMVIPADAWQLENFRKNPVFLWSHSYFDPPIGTVTDIAVEDSRLMATVKFDQEDEIARKIEAKYRSGILSAVSVGWDTLSWEPPNGEHAVPRVTKADLLDLSAVSVPSDPSALKERQKRAYAEMGMELLKIAEAVEPDVDVTITRTLKPDASVRMTWNEAAAAMVDVLRPFTLRPDDVRKTEHQKLERDYARLGKTAPEFKTNAELEAFGMEEIRGLFVEGEPELFADRFAAMESRAGAVLSTRNQDDLRKASELINGVLERAKKEAESTDDERAIRELRRVFAGASA